MATATGTTTDPLDTFNTVVDYFLANGWTNPGTDRYDGFKNISCNRYTFDQCWDFFKPNPDAGDPRALYVNDTIAVQFFSSRTINGIRMVAHSSISTQYITGFTLQYSQDGSIWNDTNVAVSGLTWAPHDIKGWDVTTGVSAPWWRIKITGVAGGAGYFGSFFFRESPGDAWLRTYRAAAGVTLESTYDAQGNKPLIHMNLWSNPVGNLYSIFQAAGVSYTSSTYWGCPVQVPELNLSSAKVYTPILNGACEYWLTGTSRFVVGVIRSATTYHSFYSGLFLPYASPLEYPYPMAIGGTSTQKADQFSTEREDLGTFVNPTYRQDNGTLIFYSPYNSWQSVYTWALSGGARARQNVRVTTPFWETDYGFRIAEPPAGGSPGRILPEPVAIVSFETNKKDVYGVLDHCYACPSFNLTSKDTIVVPGLGTIRAFQDIYRTGWYNMWGILEEA